MRKWITGIFGWLFVLVVAGCIAAFIAWTRLPDYLSGKLSKTLGVAVEIEDIELSLSAIKIDNLEIGNIKGGILPRAFSAETISINTALRQYAKNPITIDKIEINNVYLGLEFDSATSTKGNWTRILGNIQSPPPKEGRRKRHKPTPQEKPPTDGKAVFIKTVVINNISTDLVYVKGDGRIKKLPPIKQIVLSNINTEEGFPVDQLTSSVLGQMLTQVFIQQNLKNMLDTILPNVPKLNEWIEPFKGLLNP